LIVKSDVLKSQPLCFAQQVDKSGRMLLTIVPTKIVKEKSIKVFICSCAFSQLKSLKYLKQPKDKLFGKLFNTEMPEICIQELSLGQVSTETINKSPRCNESDQLAEDSAKYTSFLTDVYSYNFAYGVFESLKKQ